MLCLSIKARGKEEEAGDVCGDGSGLPKRLRRLRRTWFSRRWLDVCPRVGDGMKSSFCFASACSFCFPYWTAIIVKLSFLAFLLFCRRPTGEGREREAGQVFGCWQGSSHHTRFQIRSARIVPFVQWLLSCKMYKLFWVRPRTNVPLAALSGEPHGHKTVESFCGER